MTDPPDLTWDVTVTQLVQLEAPTVVDAVDRALAELRGLNDAQQSYAVTDVSARCVSRPHEVQPDEVDADGAPT